MLMKSGGREFESRPARHSHKGAHTIMKKAAVTEHVLTPKHTKLSESDKKQILEQYGVTVKELPTIFITDPALDGMTVKAGDVIKIERNSRTAGKTVFYRSIVE